MKIAIGTQEAKTTSPLSSKGARSSYYLIFEDGKLLEAMKNPFAVGGGGAGFSVAKILAEKNVTIVIGKKFGEHMKSSLQERGVNFQETNVKSAEEVLNNRND